jgi:hypothetical protein
VLAWRCSRTGRRWALRPAPEEDVAAERELSALVAGGWRTMLSRSLAIVSTSLAQRWGSHRLTEAVLLDEDCDTLRHFWSPLLDDKRGKLLLLLLLLSSSSSGSSLTCTVAE